MNRCLDLTPPRPFLAWDVGHCWCFHHPYADDRHVRPLMALRLLVQLSVVHKRSPPFLPLTTTAKGSPMSSFNPLGQLRRLDGSSPGFHDQLSHVLYGEEYKKWVSSIDGEDLVWLVDYLDKVRCHVAVPDPRLTRSRLSMVSTLLVPASGNAYANSEAYAAPTRYYRLHTCFRVLSRVSAACPSLREVQATYTKASSTAQEFLSNAFGYTLWMVRDP